MTTPKGRFVFIPEGSDEAFEIDVEELMAAQKETLFGRFLNWLNSFRVKTAPAAQLNKVSAPSLNIPQEVCKKFEELFTTAVWLHKDMYDKKALHIMDVYPKNHAEGWEPYVRLAGMGSTPRELSLVELLTNYDPYSPETDELHS